MRVFGWVLAMLGIIFELLFVVAALGGAKISPVAFGIGAFMAVGGWRLAKYGRAIAPNSASLDSVPQAMLQAVAPNATEELPFTPAVAGLVARELAHSRRVTTIVISVLASAFLALGAILEYAVSPHSLNIVALFALIGIATGLIVGGIWIATNWRPARRDLNDSSYLRTSGPVELVPAFGGYILRLTDRAFLVNGKQVGGRLRKLKLTWGIVDYSRHAHVVFEIRDHSGQSLYRLPGYDVSVTTLTAEKFDLRRMGT